MTAKQKAARAKFKAVVKEASKLRKKNPKLTQAQAVKQAWAISYSKKRSGSKLAEVGKVKKKKAVKSAKVKATKVKARKKKSSSEMHTDTKSHNVNISVMSGHAKDHKILNDYKDLLGKIKYYETTIAMYKDAIKNKKSKF